MMKRILMLAGLLAGPALADPPIMVWGLGLDACPALVKASDDNATRFKADHKGAKLEDINFADAVIPYFQYVAGVAQGYQQGSHQALTSDPNALFFGAVDYCRKNPGDKVVTAVANALADAKFGESKQAK
jgi:hypothetical protein